MWIRGAFLSKRFIYSNAIARVMATTIQLRETTKQLLDTVKIKENIHTYDQAIRHLVKKHVDIPKSMFGVFAKHPIKFTREDKIKLHEL